MRLLLRHERGDLGPYTVDEWARPNGDECLLIWMLRELEASGTRSVELVAVEENDFSTDYYTEMRPWKGDTWPPPK